MKWPARVPATGKPWVLAGLALLLACPGCFTYRFELNGYDSDGALMTAPKERVVDHFKSSGHVWYLAGGLYPLSPETPNELLRKEIGTRKVANVRFEQRMDFWEAALSVGLPFLVTLGLFWAATPNPATGATSPSYLPLAALPLAFVWPQVYNVTIEGDIAK